MFLADAHCDTLFNREIGVRSAADCTVTPERLRRGGVCLQTFAIFAGMTCDLGTPPWRGDRMLAGAEKLGVPLIRGKLPDLPPTSPHGILSVEGGEVFAGDLSRFEAYARAGVKLVALTWNYENEIGYPCGMPARGLKPFGLSLLAAMDRAGVLADVSHLSAAGFEDVIACAKLPPVASHSDVRALCDVPRNLDNGQIDQIIARRGFIGVNFYAGFLAKGRASIDDVLRHIDALCARGGEDVVGFGSDFDGIDAWPEGLATPEDFPALLDRLASHGYTEAQLAKIAGLNFWRVLKEAERQCAAFTQTASGGGEALDDAATVCDVKF